METVTIHDPPWPGKMAEAIAAAERNAAEAEAEARRWRALAKAYREVSAR